MGRSGIVEKRLSAHGLIAIQSTSPYYARRAFWCVVATLEDAGFKKNGRTDVRAGASLDPLCLNAAMARSR